MNVPVSRLDLLSAELAADPWPILRELREQGPVAWHQTYGRWMITTDREVRAVVADYKRFTVEGTVVEDLFGAQAFISMDDRKRHDSLRLVWADAFRKTALEALRPTIQAIVDELMSPIAEKLHAGERVDFLSAVCRPLPTLVIALMMGVPRDVLPDVVRWSNDMAAGGPAYQDDPVAAQAALDRREAAKAGLADYLGELIAARRAEPQADLVSALVSSEAARGLPDLDLMQNVRQLLFAGNETTAKWLGHIFVTYAERPEVQRELAADRSLVVQANDEVMRWQGVIGSVVRRVRGGAVQIAGVELADGDGVTLLLPSANRDPARFESPDSFDIHRPPSPNLGFGVGLHHCLGIGLAKVEAEIAVNTALDKLPRLSMAVPCRYSSLPMRGPHSVEIVADVS